jgi:hypothetical protein
MNYKLYKLLTEIPYKYSDYMEIRQEVIEDFEEEESEEE